MSVIRKTSPVTGEVLGEFEISTPEQVNEAVARAREASVAWRNRTMDERFEVLERMRAIIDRRGEEFARRISEDTGKALLDALMTEMLVVPLFIDHYRRNAEKILKTEKVWPGMLFPGKKAHIEYFPMGVIGVIAPWNFPFQLSMVPVISAIIGGNTVVLKPSEVTPLTGELIRELCEEAKVPRGVIEVVQGDGSTGAALVEADIDMVFFTGSVNTGRKVMAAASKKPIPVELELGGKDAMIVCADANLKRAAKGAMWGALVNGGQMCTSVERLFVVESVHDEFVELLRAEMEAIVVGDTQDVDMGAITFAPQLKTIEEHLAEAKKAGANIVCGGERIDRPGMFFSPTLVTGVDPEMLIYREETFGPVLPVIKVASEEEAVRLANDHQYGLTGSVWTSDIDKGRRIASQMECGQVGINDLVQSVGNPKLPFGGVKSSGFGRYHGDEGLLTFMHAKAVMISSGRFDSEAVWFPYHGKYGAMTRLFHSVLGGQLLGMGKAFVDLLRTPKD
ncbi:aldehyde dehydrogenase family protein [Bradymonas sediminis]|uniref:Aldehyde dehydrogenase n=1 Tax=Bradymonas sediminis TaxID=1548548 RepID=A0A2Z4FGR5_9DELT|nr:aldehyde dehydrogenase family protein [Bradymonas sediminis]AWV87905.1 aldehyde dehydrogenase [Bradymonas sediminis]TDP62922.1 acyl-CoA reductase-like NAD-dependent aldehyde dehydrogenase [Bradymonas sediminis]